MTIQTIRADHYSIPLPFDDQGGTIPNEGGRVVDNDGRPIPGVYVSGWIKRGPNGVIGTNKPDGKETADAMVTDAGAGRAFMPTAAEPASAESLVRERQPRVISYANWQRLDAIEVERGERAGRPRVKFTDTEMMLQALS